MLESGKILVTGGAGFIGSALVWALNRRGLRNILIADFLGKSEKWKNLPPLQFEDYFEADDLLAMIEDGSTALDEVTTVFHLGARSLTTATDASALIRDNFGYTKSLAEWSLKKGARFLYASSAATYGARETGLSEDRDLHTLRPLNIYGYSKHLFDLHAGTKGYLDTITGIKYFNVFGPNEYHKGDMRSLVNKAFHQIGETGKIEIFKSHRAEYSDGEQRRDFLYVKDAVEMTIHLAEDNRRCGLFNVGSGIAHSWLEIADALFTAMRRPAKIEFIEMPEALRGKYQYFTQASVERLRSSGYDRPATPLKEAIADYVVHYLEPGLRLGDEPRLEDSINRPG